MSHDTKQELNSHQIPELDGVIGHLQYLTDPMGPISRAVEHTKSVAAITRTTQKTVQRVAWIQVLNIFLVAALTGALVVVVLRLQGVQKSMISLAGKMNATERKVEEVKQKQTQEAERKERIEKDTSAKVELVPETDPVKARKAPIKVRISATHPEVDATAPVPAPSAVEVPVPLEHTK